MNHLRTFYYLSTGIITLCILLIILTSFKKNIFRRTYLSFAVFYLFTSLHLFFIFIDLYFRFNIANFTIFNPHIFSQLAVFSSRIRIGFYMIFLHSFFKKKLFNRLNITIIPLTLAVSIFNHSIAYIFTILYFVSLLIYLYLKTDDISNPYRNLIKYMMIISLITLVPFIFDLLEELNIFFKFLSIDFYPLCFISIGFAFVISISRNLKIISSNSKMLKHEKLTNRENEIVNKILQGLTNQNIAEQLYISESTVKKHINNIFRKLNIKSRWELNQIANK